MDFAFHVPTSPLTHLSKRATWRETCQSRCFVTNSTPSLQETLRFLPLNFWLDVKLACAAHDGHKGSTVKVRWIECSIINIPSPTELMPLFLPSLVTSITTTSPRCLKPYRFGDKKYEGFQLPDPDVIHNRLISRCHSMRLLKSAGFVLPQDLSPVTSTIAKEIYVLKKTVCSPESDPLASKRKVIVIDCEMAYSDHDTDEAVSICVVDFFTGEVLMNKLVKPHEVIVEHRSRTHGITRKRLNTALMQGETLKGWRETRKELFTHIDSNTVIIGHAVHNDLKVLRICHTTVLDTMILTNNAVSGGEQLSRRNWSLQSLCEELFGLHIRASSKKHRALEDTMAAREIALYCICYPERLQEWVEGIEKTRMAKRALKGKGKRKVKTMIPPTSSSDSTEGDASTVEAEISVDRT